MIELETKIRIYTAEEYRQLRDKDFTAAKALESPVGYLWFFNTDCACWELLQPYYGLANHNCLTHVTAHSSFPYFNYDGTQV